MKKLRILAMGAVLGASSLASLPAASINVQFGQGSYIGYGAAPGLLRLTAPPYWNFYAEPSKWRMLDLKDVAGQETDVVVFATYQSKFWGNQPGTKGRSPAHLLGNGLYGPVTFQIRNLDASKTYDVYAYVFNKSNEPTTVTLSDTNGSYVRSPSPVDQSDDFHLDQNYVVFSDVAPVAGLGKLVLTVEGGGTGLNGLQFVERAAPTPVSRPTVAFRSDSPVIVSTGRKVTVRGTATSNAGIRKVWYSLDRGKWRSTQGTLTWSFTVAVSKRTHVFVRAEDIDGRYSEVESAVVVPRFRF
jgi:hypothetical protein